MTYAAAYGAYLEVRGCDRSWKAYSDVIGKVDRRNHPCGIRLALLLNPTRSVANALGQAPWTAPTGLSRRATD